MVTTILIPIKNTFVLRWGICWYNLMALVLNTIGYCTRQLQVQLQQLNSRGPVGVYYIYALLYINIYYLHNTTSYFRKWVVVVGDGNRVKHLVYIPVDFCSLYLFNVNGISTQITRLRRRPLYSLFILLLLVLYTTNQHSVKATTGVSSRRRQS